MEILIIASIMQPLNWLLPFKIMQNASDYAIGVVLGQWSDKKLYVVFYTSKTLNDAQTNYTTTEMELLAIGFAPNKFCSYTLGSHVIFTNLSMLKYVLAKGDTKPRLIQ